MILTQPVKIKLALQGGGAHGAFTWGVLDRLLDEPNLVIESVSGTSAGAMNAVMLAEGMRLNGAEGAKQKLEAFWRQVSLPAEYNTSLFSTLQAPFIQYLTQHLSPYELNPLDFSPLRENVEALVDFEKLRQHSPVQLYIAATEVRSGRLALFTHQVLSAEHLLASACLPSLSQAIEIDGESYWDGGFTANPAIFPLLRQGESDDYLMVLLQPLERAQIPKSAREISDRVSELGFQAAFMREMQTLVEQQTYNKKHWWRFDSHSKKLRRARFHLIGPDTELKQQGRISKLNTQETFIEALYSRGRAHADQWLSRKGARLGVRTSCTLKRYFL